MTQPLAPVRCLHPPSSHTLIHALERDLDHGREHDHAHFREVEVDAVSLLHEQRSVQDLPRLTQAEETLPPPRLSRDPDHIAEAQLQQR